MCGHLDNAMICLGFLNVGSFILNIRNTLSETLWMAFLATGAEMQIVRSRKEIREDC